LRQVAGRAESPAFNGRLNDLALQIIRVCFYQDACGFLAIEQLCCLLF
jgi:hypothetical protein